MAVINPDSSVSPSSPVESLIVKVGIPFFITMIFFIFTRILSHAFIRVVFLSFSNSVLTNKYQTEGKNARRLRDREERSFIIANLNKE